MTILNMSARSKFKEQKLKLKELVRREQSEDRQLVLDHVEDYERFLKMMNGAADHITEIEEKGFAKGEIVEDNFIHSISMLHTLGFDGDKIKLILESRK